MQSPDRLDLCHRAGYLPVIRPLYRAHHRL